MERIRATVVITCLGLSLACAAKGAAKVSTPGARLFAGQDIPRFEIQIDPNQIEQLRRANRTYVRATVTVGANTLQNVGVRLKGHGSFQPLDEKPSLSLKFDKFI